MVTEPRVCGRVAVELGIDLGDVSLVGTEDYTRYGGKFAPATE